MKYYKSALYPGTGDPTSPVFGAQVNYYLNGLGDITGENYYNMLDGLLQQTQILRWPGQYTLIADDDGLAGLHHACRRSDRCGGARRLCLNGGFVAQVAKTTIENSVTSVKQTNYLPADFTAPYSGQPVSTTTITYGGTGAQETFTTVNTYGYEIDISGTAGPLIALHMLRSIAQSAVNWTRAATDDGIAETVTARADATTYTGFAQRLRRHCIARSPPPRRSSIGSGRMRCRFPSAHIPSGPCRMVGSAQSGFRNILSLANRQSRRTNVLAPCNPRSSPPIRPCPWRCSPTPRWPTEPVPILASRPMRQLTGWDVTGAQIVTGDAHTGQNSLGLPAGGVASASVTITPPNANATYLLGFWYKLASPGFAANFGYQAARRKACILLVSCRSVTNFVKMELLGAFWRNPGRLWRSVMATTSLGGRDAGANGSQPGAERVPDEPGMGNGKGTEAVPGR